MNSSEAGNTAADATPPHAPGSTDDALRLLVAAVNAQKEPADGIGVTLTIPTGVISGLLIPNWQWMNEQDMRIRQATRAEEPTGVGYIFSEFAEMYRPKDGEFDSDAVTYIHLKKAQIITSSGAFPTEGIHWRGLLTHVSGWSFGVLEDG